jgi:hypothetical protein
MGYSKTNFKSNACHLRKVIIPNPNFHFFGWDSTAQPRTAAAARTHGLQDNFSPDIGS